MDASVSPSGEVIILWSAADDVQAVTPTTTQPGWATFPDPRTRRGSLEVFTAGTGPRLGRLLRRRRLWQLRVGWRRGSATDRLLRAHPLSADLKVDWRFPSHVNNPWGAISDCYALNVDADAVWTCYCTDFPIVRVHDGDLTGWRTDGIAADALIVDGSRIALYSGYGADRDRLVTGQLADGRMWSTGEYRVVLTDGRDLPDDACIIGRGPDLHILTSGDWCGSISATCRPNLEEGRQDGAMTFSAQPAA
ncbi:hypothetical protein ACFYYL_42020 [Actinomadura geliboluensis]|uniref:hypothetical protein n=1 Tax=Actinomadura geliboluensis TaxID=882440 RepID=UPI0036A3C5E7